MRVLLGVFVLAAGSLGLAQWFETTSTDSGLAVVTGVSSKGIANLAIPPPERSNAAADATQASSTRFFGFALPPVVSGNIADAAEVEQPSEQAASVRREPAPARVPAGWSTEVVVYSGGRDEIAAGTRIAPASVLPQPPRPVAVQRERPHPELVRELQRELRRVGCYLGDIDGDWGAASRRSMRTFMDRVTSNLQSDNPDLIQLTLVRGYPGVACRTTLPAGQMMAVRAPSPGSLARREAVPVFAATTASTVRSGGLQAGPVAPSSPVVAGRPMILEGRMSVGAPVPSTVQLEAGPSLAAPPSATLPSVTPPTAAPAPRFVRPRVQAPPRRETRRADRNWTRNFFDQ